MKNEDLVVVGIGASAGGLEALERLFSTIPNDIKCAFIIVQHLSPDYKSLMNKLLERVTHIPITIIQDGMEIKNNTIYLNPPRKNVIIQNNRLLLEEQAEEVLHLPIDVFFHSLGINKKSSSIGVILSGTGRDGSQGIKTIKANGGLVITQDLKSAKFQGMPQSAIATACVDYTFNPEHISKIIVNYIGYIYSSTSMPFSLIEAEDNNLSQVINVLKDFTDIDFSRYKETIITRRLDRRMTVNKQRTFNEYLSFLNNSLDEKRILSKELLIGVSSFFRDKEAFLSLKDKVLTELAKEKNLKIWCVGCSTGQEVYSLLIYLLEIMDNDKLDINLKIFATDVDKESLNIASLGFYPPQIKNEIDEKLIDKYFTAKKNGFQIKENVRKYIVFAKHNILTDSPFTKIDLILCRNLFIYLKEEVQEKLLKMFYYCLKPNKYLMLGSSENVGNQDNLFSINDFKWKIFQKIKGQELALTERLPYLISKSNKKAKSLHETSLIQQKNQTLQLLTESFNKFIPPSILVSQNGEILYILNDVSDFVHFQEGSFNQNIFSKVSKNISIQINAIIRKLKMNTEIDYLESIVNDHNQANDSLVIAGRTLTLNDENYFIISFETRDLSSNNAVSESEISKRSLLIEDCEELQKELNYTKENLRVAVEELESSNEELQSSNEELMASNEELQSTNEELQSVNEELYSVNNEFQEKIVELERMNIDTMNLLDTTEIGALYLDNEMKIRKVTPLIYQLTNISKTDIGRPIHDISLIDDNSLLEDIKQVEESLTSIDKQLQLRNGKSYLIRLRPYRTEYNSVDGILVSFIEISDIISNFKQMQT
jgi:two-component system CheB/CheR fusion protein